MKNKLHNFLFGEKFEINVIILYVITAILPVILFFVIPQAYRFLFTIICFILMNGLFIKIKNKAKTWQASPELLRIASLVILEITAIGTIFWINIISSGSINIVLAIIGAILQITLGLLYGINLHLRINKPNPALIQKEEEDKTNLLKILSDFNNLSKVTNNCLEIAMRTAEELPIISNNFKQITDRVVTIEKNIINIINESETRNKELIDKLNKHSEKSAETIKRMKTEAIALISNENNRANAEASEIVSSMSKSLDDITEAIENSFAPFLESVNNLSLIDEKTSVSIDRMAEAANIFVKISEPQARLASEAAILIEESVANIRNIASRSLSIMELELKNVIDDAVAKLQNTTTRGN